MSALTAALAMPPVLPLKVPVDPDAPEAQQWLLKELAKPQYQGAKPGLFEQLLQQFLDWLQSILPRSAPNVGGFDLTGVLSALVIAVVVVLLVVAFLVFGLPRLNRRSKAGGDLFGDDDERDADALRRDARRAADAGDYATAVVELFRALARRLDERAVVATFPGTTARGFARRAGQAFPDAADRLGVCAADFDAVRYLDAAGTVEQWERIRALEAELHDARPPRSESLDDVAGMLA
jgi:hypothetical protein